MTDESAPNPGIRPVIAALTVLVTATITHLITLDPAVTIGMSVLAALCWIVINETIGFEL